VTPARPYRRATPRALAGLGASDVVTQLPSAGSPQPPIWPLRVGAHGAYLEVRSSPSDGACGVSNYPCRHPGVDVAGPYGTPVAAPETGVVVAATDGSSAPFVGYGPWLLIIRGVASGKYHLLAHLDPSGYALAPVGTQVKAGQKVGTVSSANHTHWELRTKMVPDFAHGETNFTNNSDPLAWLDSSSSEALAAVLLLGGAALLAYLMWRS